jgi:hypothetical protein
MLTKFAATLAAGAAFVAAASPAAAATFNLTSIGSNQGTMRSFQSGGSTYWRFDSATVDGISFSAYAYSTDSVDRWSVPELGNVQRFDHGLGALNSGDGNGSWGQHTIDNIGRYDFLTLEFNKAVSLTGIGLTAFSVDGKPEGKDAWIGFGTQSANMSDLDKFMAFQSITANAIRVPNGVMPSAQAMSTRVGNVWLIGADRTAVTAERNDGFKLGAITVTPNVAAVPEPATWATMMLGFGLAGAAIRRRRTSVAFAA